VTEPKYLEGLRRHFSAAIVELEIPEDRGDPLTLVQIARREQDDANALARRTNEPYHAYDRVWCAFDVDEHDKRRFNDAKQIAASNGIELAISNPCIELWLLLHFRENPGEHHRHHLQKMMREFVTNYDKHVDFAQLIAGYDKAVARAQRLDHEATEQGEPGRNPTTSIYVLTEAIRWGS